MTGLDIYDLPFFNAAGQTIPPYAVMQQSWEGVVAGRDYFRAIKPNGQGKKYALNGPLPIPAGGLGRGTIHRGAFALVDPNIYAPPFSPVVDEELGPISGQWYLGRNGSGFFVDGDAEGDPPSLPGAPSSDGSRRVRVTMQAAGAKATQLVRFELAADKSLPSPPFCDAYLLDDQDQKILDIQNNPVVIAVSDRRPTIFAGLGPYTDKKYGDQPGNRGWAQFTTATFGGKQGFEIITMDGQARWLQGKLADDWTFNAQDTGPSAPSEIEVDNYWGAAPNNRPPKTREKDYGGGGTGQPSDKRNIVDTYDDFRLRTGKLKKGQVVVAVYDELRRRYELAAAPAAPAQSAGGLYQLQTSASAATQAGGDLTPGVAQGRRMKKVEGSNPLKWTPDASAANETLYNSVKQTVENQKIVQTNLIDEEPFIVVEDCTSTEP